MAWGGGQICVGRNWRLEPKITNSRFKDPDSTDIAQKTIFHIYHIFLGKKFPHLGEAAVRSLLLFRLLILPACGANRDGEELQSDSLKAVSRECRGVVGRSTPRCELRDVGAGGSVGVGSGVLGRTDE